MAIRNMKYTAAKPPAGTVQEEAYIEGIPSGSGEPYELPAATTSTLGGVKQAAHVASAAGENVTAAEFEALLDALEAAGIVATA